MNNMSYRVIYLNNFDTEEILDRFCRYLESKHQDKFLIDNMRYFYTEDIHDLIEYITERRILEDGYQPEIINEVLKIYIKISHDERYMQIVVNADMIQEIKKLFIDCDVTEEQMLIQIE